MCFPKQLQVRAGQGLFLTGILHAKVGESVQTAGRGCSTQLAFVPGSSSVLVQFGYVNTRAGKEEPVVTSQDFGVPVSYWIRREIRQCLSDVSVRWQLRFPSSPALLLARYRPASAS